MDAGEHLAHRGTLLWSVGSALGLVAVDPDQEGPPPATAYDNQVAAGCS